MSIGLSAGTYTLIEAKAPQGYSIAPSIRFTVNPDGTITSPGNVDAYGNIIMRDHKINTLPKTGVEDNWALYMGGSVSMMAISGWMLWILFRKKEQDVNV